MHVNADKDNLTYEKEFSAVVWNKPLIQPTWQAVRKFRNFILLQSVLLLAGCCEGGQGGGGSVLWNHHNVPAISLMDLLEWPVRVALRAPLTACCGFTEAVSKCKCPTWNHLRTLYLLNLWRSNKVIAHSSPRSSFWVNCPITFESLKVSVCI